MFLYQCLSGAIKKAASFTLCSSYLFYNLRNSGLVILLLPENFWLCVYINWKPCETGRTIKKLMWKITESKFILPSDPEPFAGYLFAESWEGIRAGQQKALVTNQYTRKDQFVLVSVFGCTIFHLRTVGLAGTKLSEKIPSSSSSSYQLSMTMGRGGGVCILIPNIFFHAGIWSHAFVITVNSYLQLSYCVQKTLFHFVNLTSLAHVLLHFFNNDP